MHSITDLLSDTIKLVIFDIDQTLLDTRERNDQAVGLFLKELGLDDNPMLREYILSNSSKTLERSLSKTLGRAITSEEISVRYVRSYHASSAPIIVIPETIPLIRLLRSRNIRVAAATSAGTPIIDINLRELEQAYNSEQYAQSGHPDHLRKDPLFEAVVYAEPGMPHKPEYEAYLLLEQRLQQKFKSNSVLVIGDSQTDQDFAKHIGAWFRKIHPGYSLKMLYDDVNDSIH